MLSPIALILISLIAGGVLGLLLSQKCFGCWSLTLIPIATYAYVDWWQGQHPELMRSTSGLDFFFVQFPTLIGGLAGYGLVAFAREWRA
jgi:hypothetical protein